MENISWSELEAFVREEVGLRETKALSPATRLWEDLGQTGDDATHRVVDRCGDCRDRYPRTRARAQVDDQRTLVAHSFREWLHRFVIEYTDESPID